MTIHCRWQMSRLLWQRKGFGSNIGEGLFNLLISGEVDQESMQFLVPAISRLARRSFVISSEGYLGLAPGLGCLKGDLICILGGGDVPFVLREKVELRQQNADLDREQAHEHITIAVDTPKAQARWVGEPCIHGIMQDEAVSAFERSQTLGIAKIGFEIKRAATFLYGVQ